MAARGQLSRTALVTCGKARHPATTALSSLRWIASLLSSGSMIHRVCCCAYVCSQWLHRRRRAMLHLQQSGACGHLISALSKTGRDAIVYHLDEFYIQLL